MGSKGQFVALTSACQWINIVRTVPQVPSICWFTMELITGYGEPWRAVTWRLVGNFSECSGVLRTVAPIIFFRCPSLPSAKSLLSLVVVQSIFHLHPAVLNEPQRLASISAAFAGCCNCSIDLSGQKSVLRVGFYVALPGMMTDPREN